MQRASADAQPPPSRLYVWWVMGLLLCINILSFVDRQIPFILAQSIKRDLKLSDTDIGLLGGIAFGIVYSTLGLPLARMGERFGRRWVLSGALVLWSGLTACGGIAQNFGQLLGTRLGVAAGEAAATPLGHSLISSYFPERKRSSAIAIFSLGVPLGTMVGLILGGWIDHVASWRQAMVAIGLPGILLALVAVLTVREPSLPRATRPADEALLPTLKTLWSRRSFRQMAYGVAVYSAGANATIVFVPAFLMRTYGINSAATGLSLGLLYGVAGVIGTLAGGVLGDRLGARDGRWRLWAPAIALFVAMPFTLGALFAPNAGLSVVLLAGPKFANLLYLGPVFVALHSIAPVRSRATASAFLLFFNSLIGLSLGPLATGAVSDWLQPTLGAQSLRYALCLVVLTQLWSGLHFLLAARSLARDVEANSAQAA